MEARSVVATTTRVCIHLITHRLLQRPAGCTIAPLQRVLNAAARIVVGLPGHVHVIDTMRSLHWLPVCYLIRYKLCLVMYNGTSPSYITETTTIISTLPGSGRRSQRFLCGKDPRMERSAGRDLKHHRSIFVQACHKTHFLISCTLTHNFRWFMLVCKAPLVKLCSCKRRHISWVNLSSLDHSCLLVPLSCTLVPLSCTLVPLSCTLVPLSCTLVPLSCTLVPLLNHSCS